MAGGFFFRFFIQRICILDGKKTISIFKNFVNIKIRISLIKIL